jgi:hypothetical protein
MTTTHDHNPVRAVCLATLQPPRYSQDEVRRGTRVRREQVATELGRLWMSGAVSSDDYFRQVREDARRQARTSVAQRLARGRRRFADTGR